MGNNVGELKYPWDLYSQNCWFSNYFQFQRIFHVWNWDFWNI